MRDPPNSFQRAASPIEPSPQWRVLLTRPKVLDAIGSRPELVCQSDSFCETPVLPYKRGMQSPIPEKRSSIEPRSSSIALREILDIKAAANYLGVSRSHLSHLLEGKIPGLPAIPHVRAGRRALIRRAVIDDWLLQQEHGPAVEVAR